jgi:hypothetical protein
LADGRDSHEAIRTVRNNAALGKADHLERDVVRRQRHAHRGADLIAVGIEELHVQIRVVRDRRGDLEERHGPP